MHYIKCKKKINNHGESLLLKHSRANMAVTQGNSSSCFSH